MEARLGYIGKPYFGFFRRGAGTAALGDVLLSAACGLHHLVDGTVALREKALREHEG